MGQLLTTASVLMCPHGGTVSAVSSNTRVKATGDYVLRPSDTLTIAGCPFPVGGVPHPCVMVKWIVPGVRVKAAGDNALTTDSVGLCIAADNAPQGSVLVNVAQPRVRGR